MFQVESIHIIETTRTRTLQTRKERSSLQKMKERGNLDNGMPQKCTNVKRDEHQSNGKSPRFRPTEKKTKKKSKTS